MNNKCKICESCIDNISKQISEYYTDDMYDVDIQYWYEPLCGCNMIRVEVCKKQDKYHTNKKELISNVNINSSDDIFIKIDVPNIQNKNDLIKFLIRNSKLIKPIVENKRTKKINQIIK